MQIKYLLLISLLLAVTKQVTVTKTDTCDDCTQFKSSLDCKAFGCTWTDKTAAAAGSCAKSTTPPPVTFTPYCSTIETANCAKTFGCALVEGKCTHFTGCSAYVKTTHSDCQAISYMCITNGTTCTNALECVGYTKEQCETTPSLKSPYKCKLDGETCRDYKCIEADSSLTTDLACSTWLLGCRSTGAGCIDLVPPCASYQGTSETCPKMKGSDGNCEFNADGNVCKARVCTGADTGLNTNEACAQYQVGCVTTGKGCIATRGACSTYDGNASTCIGYIGTDGECAGDATGTKCRARLCSEKTATTDAECGTWKTGCKSNGKQCVDSLGACSSYDGTTTTCAGLKGSDGNCKGTSTTTAKCALKDCVTDSNDTFKTQAQCEAIQSNCKTTGKGCVATLAACSSYSYTDDGTSCNSWYGSDGRCKPGTAGKCAARVCTEALTSLTTNKQCDDYKSGCVTTGAGCVSTTVCQDTVKQVTCEGTGTCGWNSICVSKTSCGQLLTKSICESVKISNKPCKWDTGTCRNARCDDFTATDDNTCNTLLENCVTNGTKCVDGTNCAAQFKGTQQACQAFKAKCTNDTNAADTAVCKARTCDDSYLTYDNDQDCGNYLTGCVTKGSGCIIDTAVCSSYSGTPEQCDKFKGNKTTRCWNTGAATVSGACVDKQCTQATSMGDDTACESFLTGCLYDGNGSCVAKSAACTAYTGTAITCLNFKGSSAANPCFQGVGGKCRNKTCSDDITSQSDGDCNTFLPDCVTKGTGCIDKTSQCTAYSGTTDKCLTFTGKSGADKCTRLEACVSKATTCASKTGIAGNDDCLSYHADCRFKFGDTACMQSQTVCTSYTLTGTDDAAKQTYCNLITTSSAGSCSYDTGVVGTCSARACNLWVSTLTNITCDNYNGTASCKLNGASYCYAPLASCASYTIPNSTTDKLAWCNAMFTNAATPTKCSYDAGVSTTACSNIDSCEEIISPTSAAYCNKILDDGDCQFTNNKCITTKNACTGYLLTGITTGQAAYCSGLRSDNSGTVTKCSYISGTSTTTCVDEVVATVANPAAITVGACNTISSPTSQADCNLGTGSCKYYSGACYARVACASYTVVGADATAKQNFCQNMYDNTANTYCSYNAGACAAGKAACTDYSTLAGADDAAKTLECSKLRIKTGSACGFTASGTACAAPADAAASCTLVTSDITADADCALRTILGCKKHATNPACIANGACTAAAPTGTGDAQVTSCQAFIGPDSKYCTFTTGANCAVAQSACSGYSTLPSGTELAYCSLRINENGQRCTWVTPATACSDPSATCVSYTGLTGTDMLKQCQAKNDLAGVRCSWNIGTTACIAAPKTCAGWNSLPTSGQLEFCQARIKSDGLSCSWVSGTSCTDAPAACTSLASLPNSGELAYCVLRIKQDGVKCSWTSGGNCITQPTACTDWSTQPSLEFCQARSNISGNRCSFVAAAAACSDAQAACTGYSTLPSPGQLAFCQARVQQDGTKCSWTAGGAACRAYSCEDTASPQSQADCDTTGTGCTYEPQLQICYKPQTACTSYTPAGSTEADKLNYCNNLLNSASTPVGCTYIKGKASVTTCSVLGACTSYDVSDVAAADKLAACQGVIPSSGSCTYFSGNTCVAVAACSTYTGGSSGTIVVDCAKQKDTTGLLCYGSGTACAAATCENVTGATSLDDCKKYATNCVYAGGKCYTTSATCAYSTGGTNAISTCNSLKNTGGNFCTADADADANCKDRTCDDTATNSFQTHDECKTYHSTAKQTVKVVSLLQKTCAQQSGYLSYCEWALDTNSKSTCAKATADTNSAACTKLTCELNVTATSDSECISFNSDCLNKGLGCILKTEPCSSYYGTKTSCQAFTGNGKKCYGDSTTTTKAACRDRQCTDMSTATSDSECENFLTGCLFNGVGCVHKSAACSSYKGTQATCSGFKGSNGTKYCWGSSTTVVGNCADRKCSDKVGTTDAECQTFLPPIAPSKVQLCITDGKTCVDIGKACSFFKGNDDTCLLFTANDGPCKASSVSASPVACTSRVCYEAPNTYTTDDQCSKYHPSCKTTGRGCKSTVGCGELTSQASCTANTSCQWAGQCRTLPATCGALTTYGQAICTNTPLSTGKKCAWYNGSSSNVCRDFVCADYDGSIATHKDCNDKDTTCTTSGAGCVTLGVCSSYRSKSVCEAANTTETSVRCTWNSTTAACRQRQCADGVFTTDDACNTWLTGCKTSGTACVGPNFGCDVFTGNPKLCLKNSAKNPCLYVNGICYDYDNCTDVSSSTYSFCQSFSKQCVPTNTTCRAITQCDKYEDINSCTIGINNTVCGWLPENKCKEYTVCSDAAGTVLSACTSWGSTCVSDGTKCVDKGTCASYLTTQACDNAGTDGSCQWTGTACRLRECTDKVATTDAECLAYTVKSGICTTDGAKCVPRATCSSYLTEAACTIGQDGIPCVYDLPVGATTGTKSCRPKECTDIKGTTNDACVSMIPNKACVSNGVNCVKQDTCANYKNRLSCKAGGSDGKCAFTPAPTTADPNNGTCVSFKSCENANSDQDACVTKPKACKWQSTTTGTTTTTKCSSMDCPGVASGTTCNPFQSFDGTSSTICVLVNNVCSVSDPSTLTAEQCYKPTTVYTYTWNESTNKCVSCKAPTNNNNNSTNPNTTDPDTNTDDNGYILGVTIPLAILGIFV
ncbi:unnamed protein product (macronuclear) [Paramecium tetraurelia]|uniref:Uncharacterized protein n=1 Tax=Paramecium tetraurelia TaxID=5888 RepID=A0C1S7_PARTE|nr:uncharacterized protein GSPATT00034221001 [Paramecium tetraurelia]CAK64744.1 unnamed protein product [Paramecium tetraurelia]|eukprot:XP_001432141.1 hypothetical protein (macronuclear) [Paramecium tetraurelia strain d4-2]